MTTNTAQQHRDAASRVQMQLQAEGINLKRNAALNVVASAHGTNWATLKHRPDLPMLGQSRRGGAISAQLAKEGVTLDADEAAGMLFRAYPVPEVFPIILAMEGDYTYVVRGQEITCGFYENECKLSSMIHLLESLHGVERLRVVDVHDLILQAYVKENPDDPHGHDIDNEAAYLLDILESEPGVLLKLPEIQEFAAAGFLDSD